MLPAPRGTCYLALEPLGAFMETIGRLRRIDRAVVARQRLSAVVLPKKVELLDLRRREIVGAGLDASISTGDDYRKPQQVAAAADAAAMHGIVYPLRHDPDAALTGIALFDVGGERGDRPVLGTARISDTLIAEASAEFALTVEPPD